MKKSLVHRLQILIHALQDKRTPWIARGIIILTIAMAMSPIDLIPDFIPILGQLDDLLFIPIGIWVAWKLIPEEVRKEAETKQDLSLPRYFISLGLGLVIVSWIGIIGMTIWIILQWGKK